MEIETCMQLAGDAVCLKVTVNLQAEKLTQTQLFEVFRLLFYWTLGIPIPAVAGPLAIFLPNSRFGFGAALH